MNHIYKTIPDAWFSCLYRAKDESYRQEIDRGSYEETDIYRLQFPFLCLSIEHPLDDMIPSVPDGVSAPATMDSVEKYYKEYIIGPGKEEQYTYGDRILEQLEDVLKMLLETPNTNQASISIAKPSDVKLTDPPCLRVIDFKVVDGYVNISTFWRSHDLWAGFPMNLAGMALLLKDVAEYTGFLPGVMYYASHGTHLYSYQLESVLMKTRRNVE